MNDWPFCTCEEPMVSDDEKRCLFCDKPFEPKPPPALGVTVQENIVTTEKVG